MVNKGRIPREIRYFREIFWKLIKSDNELVIKIRENGGFRKVTDVTRQMPGSRSSCYDTSESPANA